MSNGSPATVGGGAVAVWAGATATLTRARLHRNSAPYGGSIAVEATGSAVVVDRYGRPHAWVCDVAVLCRLACVSVIRWQRTLTILVPSPIFLFLMWYLTISVVTDSVATQASGGGIGVVGSLTVTDTVIAGNSATT